MKRIFQCVTSTFAAVLLCNSGFSQTTPSPDAPAKYRNLFAEAGHSQKEVRQKIDSAFVQLFHGDPNTQTVYFEAGANSNGPPAFVTDIKHHDVRTEGLSYDMMI